MILYTLAFSSLKVERSENGNLVIREEIGSTNRSESFLRAFDAETNAVPY